MGSSLSLSTNLVFEVYVKKRSERAQFVKLRVYPACTYGVSKLNKLFFMCVSNYDIIFQIRYYIAVTNFRRPPFERVISSVWRCSHTDGALKITAKDDRKVSAMI